MSQNQKLSHIDLKIKALQDKKKKLGEKQNLELITLMKKVGATALPAEILMGALMEAVEAFKTDSPSLKGWKTTGETFLSSHEKTKKALKEGRKHMPPFRQTSTAHP